MEIKIRLLGLFAILKAGLVTGPISAKDPPMIQVKIISLSKSCD